MRLYSLPSEVRDRDSSTVGFVTELRIEIVRQLDRRPLHGMPAYSRGMRLWLAREDGCLTGQQIARGCPTTTAGVLRADLLVACASRRHRDSALPSETADSTCIERIVGGP